MAYFYKEGVCSLGFGILNGKQTAQLRLGLLAVRLAAERRAFGVNGAGSMSRPRWWRSLSSLRRFRLCSLLQSVRPDKPSSLAVLHSRLPPHQFSAATRSCRSASTSAVPTGIRITASASADSFWVAGEDRKPLCAFSRPESERSRPARQEPRGISAVRPAFVSPSLHHFAADVAVTVWACANFV